MLNEKKLSRITQPVLSGILHGRFGEDIALENSSLELMYAIQKELDIFEPIEDDECRLIWLEIPRGTAKEWKEAFCEEGEPTAQDEQELLEQYPRETEWVFLTTCTYREFTSLRISDRDHHYCIFCNEKRTSNRISRDMTWFMEPLLELVRQRVSDIAKAPSAYYRHIERNLPHRQRSGKIRSKDLNRILGQNLNIDNREYCIRVMKDLIRRQEIYSSPDGDWAGHNVPAPFEEMTIRTFCHYYRIADTLFRNESGSRRSRRKDQDDVKYYSNHGLHDRPDDYDLDCQADFTRFAKDHYGELGLSRMNVGATNHYANGKWLITFSFSYSAYLAKGLRIAMALYETGAPFIFYEAENVLHTLEETGWVRLSPFTFHDYIKGGDDEGVYALPYINECGGEDEITRQQYDEIVRLAKWEPADRLRLDHPIPLDSPLYGLIREKAVTPLTISQIRHLIEQEYNTYLIIAQDNETKRYYMMSPRYKGEHFNRPRKKYYSTFNKAMAALILLFNTFVIQANDSR